MAIYTPRPVSPRTRRGVKKSKWSERLRSVVPRRPVKPMPSYRPQSMGSSAHRPGAWQRWVTGGLLLALAVVAVGAVVLAAGQWLLRSDIFRLAEIRIHGEQMVTERQILDLAGLQQGGSLLRFNAKIAKERIESHPWIEHVEIRTQWPSVAEIVVSEYQPYALVNVESGKERHLFYLSRSGRLFVEAGEGQELDYPVITGVVAGRDVAGGTFVQGSLAEMAGQLLQVATRGNTVLPIQAISEVHVDAQRGLILYLVDRPFPVYFGNDRMQTKYYRLVRVLEQLYAKKLVDAVKEIRMDYLDDKVLVTGAQIDG